LQANLQVLFQLVHKWHATIERTYCRAIGESGAAINPTLFVPLAEGEKAESILQTGRNQPGSIEGDEHC
jgi:hypothetical protein